MKKVLCNAERLSQVADLGNEPLTSDDEGARVCQYPFRGGKVEAGKQGNKYFLVERVFFKCLRLTSYSKDHISSSWEGIVDCLL